MDFPSTVQFIDLVPRRHFYRHQKDALGLTISSVLVRNVDAEVGRQSIGPDGLLKLQLDLFFEALGSGRHLTRIVADRLSLLRELEYDLTEGFSDRSSTAGNFKLNKKKAFRRGFGAVVEQYIEAELIDCRRIHRCRREPVY